jgi:hypothetical protein
MPVKTLIAVMAFATLATFAWRHRDSTIVRDWAFGRLAAEGGAKSTAQTATADTRSAQGGTTTHAQPVVGVHKCQIDGKLTYTNEACPPGSREQALGGTLTVMSFPSSTPAQPSAGAASRPTIRDLVGNPGEGTLTDKRIDESFAH